jgi:hypothetical protein
MERLAKQDLTINLDNKNKFGEVHTPYSLIAKMFALLPNTIFTDPSKKWLDTGAGRGFFSLFLVEKLMDGLESSIPDPVIRKSHILTNMLWMVELNAEHFPHLTQAFPKSNIIQGDFLSQCPSLLPSSFDIVFGNPPFNAGGLKKVPTNNERNKKQDGKTIWSDFIKQSISLLASNGLLLYIVPSIWMKEDKQKMYFYMTQFKIHRLHALTNTEMNSCFKGHAQTPSCFFLLEKKPTDHTLMLFDKDAPTEDPWVDFPLRAENILPVMCAHFIKKMLPYVDKYGSLSFVHKSNLPSKHITFSNSCTEQHPFPNIKTCIIENTDQPALVINWSNNPCPFWGKKKVVLAHGMYGFPYIDGNGKYGISNRDKYVFLADNEADRTRLHSFLSSDLVFYLFNATRYRMKYLEKYIFSYLPNVLKMEPDVLEELRTIMIPQKNKYKTIS